MTRTKCIGTNELMRKLQTLPAKVFNKVVRSAITKAADPTLKAARARVPEETGALKKSLYKRVRMYGKSKTAVAIVGPRTKFMKGKRKPSKYAHLVERGHAGRFGKNIVKRSARQAMFFIQKGHLSAQGKHVPAHPFMRPAYEQTKGQAVRILKEQLGKGVVVEAQKQ